MVIMSTDHTSSETQNYYVDDSENLINKMLELNQYFECLEKANLVKKNASTSEEFRTSGNALYKQANHDQSDHIELIALYTASISFALKGSEELVKGYSNRSAVLMHLKRYQEALIDIERALLVTKSLDFKSKLESRRERCLEMVNKTNVKLPNKLPIMQPSTKFPNASEAIVIEYNERLGRHLIATRDIEAGEVIISEESYVSFPEHDRIMCICSHCMTLAWNAIPCDTCVCVVFCSEKCKNEAWQEYHDVECSIISTIFTTIESGIRKIMVTVRSIIKAVKAEGFTNVVNEIKISSNQEDNIQKLLSNGILDSKKFRSYYNLKFYTQDEEDNFDRSLFIVTLLHRCTTLIPVGKLEDLNSTDIELLMSLIKIFMRLNNILRYNTFSHQAPFCDCLDTNTCKASCDSKRGSLLAATCSLINHSCCPNVSRMFVPGKRIVMYTTTPVKKGQQLCDSYGPAFTEKRDERQKYLKEHYNFLCSCEACEEDWLQNVVNEVEKNPIASAPTFDEFIKDFNRYFPDEKPFHKNILFGFIKEWNPDKTMLDKVKMLSGLIYKYFDRRTAYSHCLNFNMYIDMTFLKFYEDRCIVLKTC